MKTIRNHSVMPAIAELKNHPIHNYGEKGNLTGQVRCQSIRGFSRKNGSCQIVFEMELDGGSGVRELELYVKDRQEQCAAMQLLMSGKPLSVDYCLRYDRYIHAYGMQTDRKFWFIDGVDAIHPAAIA